MHAQNNITEGKIWWCPSGPFTYLPLHAAAPVESKFIQSYTSTLDALIFANSEMQHSSSEDNLTAVGVVEVPSKLGNWAMLPSVNRKS
jgi:hypothetical protein